MLRVFTKRLLTLLSLGLLVASTISPSTASAAGINYRQADDVVDCAYLSLLARPADEKGRSFWIKQYRDSNFDTKRLAERLIASNEGKFVSYVTNQDLFVRRVIYNCIGHTATKNERQTWAKANEIYKISRADIFAFIVVTNGKLPALITECGGFKKPSSVKPLCTAGSAGTTRDSIIVNVPESNIYVNKAWAQNIINLRFAAAQAQPTHFYLEAYNDPSVVKDLQNVPGSKLSPGSHRSFADQTYLYNRYGYPRAAYPGTSMHEWGLAIDFKCNGVPLSQNAACLKWMRANAPKYGLYNLPREPWHWSSTGQ